MNWSTPESFKIFTESGEIEKASGKYQKMFRDMEVYMLIRKSSTKCFQSGQSEWFMRFVIRGLQTIQEI